MRCGEGWKVALLKSHRQVTICALRGHPQAVKCQTEVGTLTSILLMTEQNHEDFPR